ncbi:MAG: diacylglycerol kinase family protein [Caldilineae bacterium]|nr:MAG: diacylglycerol kinase family protein [Caldilineae bacterium]
MKDELAALARAFVYAFTGIGHLVASQRNARIHLALAVLAVILALWLGLSGTEWAVLALTIGMVLAAEGMNTAVEALVDLTCPEPHPLARIVKDTAAGAVLLTALTAVVVGCILFLPRLFALFS